MTLQGSNTLFWEVIWAMLIACDKNGERINAKNANKDNKYFCPKCGEELLLKTGEIKIPHFSHLIGSDCGYGKGESIRHMELKNVVKELIEIEYWSKYGYGINMELEYPIGDFISDGYFNLYGKDIAVEVIVHNDRLDEILEKTYAYSKMDVYTLWLWDYNIISSRVNTRGRVKYKQSMKTLQTMGYGNLNMVGDNSFILCHSGKSNYGGYGTPMKRFYHEKWLNSFFRLKTYLYKPNYDFDKYCKKDVKLCGFKIKKWW